MSVEERGLQKFQWGNYVSKDNSLLFLFISQCQLTSLIQWHFVRSKAKHFFSLTVVKRHFIGFFSVVIYI